MAGNVAVAGGPEVVESGGGVGTAGARRKSGPDRRPLAERFWAKVERSGPVMPGMDTPCWLWTGCTTEGYGTISAGGHCGRMLRASRVALEMRLERKLERHEQACHRCDNPSCVRGDHLFPGTQADNSQDASAKGRLGQTRGYSMNAGETNGRARLTAAQADAIRSRYGTVRARLLATEYGVSIGTIYGIGQGRLWRRSA